MFWNIFASHHISFSEASYISNQEPFITRSTFLPRVAALGQSAWRTLGVFCPPLQSSLSLSGWRSLSFLLIYGCVVLERINKFVNSSCLYLSGVAFFLLFLRRPYPFFSGCAPQLFDCSVHSQENPTRFDLTRCTFYPVSFLFYLFP